MKYNIFKIIFCYLILLTFNNIHAQECTNNKDLVPFYGTILYPMLAEGSPGSIGTGDAVVDHSIGSGQGVISTEYWGTSASNQYVTINTMSPLVVKAFVMYPINTGNDMTSYFIETAPSFQPYFQIGSGVLAAQEMNGTNSVRNPKVMITNNTQANSSYRIHPTTNNVKIGEFVALACKDQGPTSFLTYDLNCSTMDRLNTGRSNFGNGNRSVNDIDYYWGVSRKSGGGYNYLSITNDIFTPAVVVGKKETTWADSKYNNSEWISYTGSGLPPSSGSYTYFYKTNFRITNADFHENRRISIDMYSTGSISGIYLNGVFQNATFYTNRAGSDWTESGRLTFYADASNFALGENELVVQIVTSNTTAYTHHAFLTSINTQCNGSYDYGDSPAVYNVPTPPRHAIAFQPNSNYLTSNLVLGSALNGEAVPGVNSTSSSHTDDDGMIEFQQLNHNIINEHRIKVKVTNKTGKLGYVIAWVDWNQNGSYEQGERSAMTVTDGMVDEELIIRSYNKTFAFSGNNPYLHVRIRLSTDNSFNTTATAYTPAKDGEVEDYYVKAMPIQNIIGNVYMDTNGGDIDGTPTNLGGQLKAYLLRSGNVLQTATVAPDGTFTFPNVANFYYMTVIITTVAAANNELDPVRFLGNLYGYSAEGTTLLGDGNGNGITDVEIVDGSDTVVHFAIQELLDSDGDGIADEYDYDDDNDGITDVDECGLCEVENAFLNGSFEQNNVPGNNYSIFHESSVPGWNTTASDGMIELWNGYQARRAAHGLKWAELNAYENSTLYQQFCIPESGGTIYWSVKHRGRDGVDVAEVRIGPSLTTYNTVAIMSDDNLAWGGYSGQLNFPAGGGGVYLIMFSSVSATGGNQAVGNFIDNVEIKIVSNCRDYDTDGVVNSLDLDSDNDGCADALEGGDNVSTSQVIEANPNLTVGSGSTSPNINLCGTPACVNINGIPNIVNTGTSNTDGEIGQSLGGAHNINIQQSCPCYLNGNFSGTGLTTNIGVTSLRENNTDNWPNVREGGWLALESQTKGFVLNRLTNAQIALIPSQDLVEGMMVYNISLDCLQIYSATTPVGWHCYNGQACPINQ